MLNKIRKIYKQDGLIYVFKKLLSIAFRELKNNLRAAYFKLSIPEKFNFNGRKLSYFRHNFNFAYENERTIEVAIVEDFLRQLAKDARILEVGNVLTHYGFNNITRDVLDKYDPAPHVINKDVVNYNPQVKYDAIFSISTLEHVGWDEDVRDPEKIIAAVANLTSNCLAPHGVMLVTVPLGYNTFFDEQLSKGSSYFSEKYFFKRISSKNVWRQVDYVDLVGVKFGQPYNNANAMCIGIVHA
jgi:hypothetical protein